MEKRFIWNKGYFDSNYQLFSEGKIEASLQFDSWRNNARGIALKQSIFFKTEGFLNPVTKISNESNEVIAIITYDQWHAKATLTLKDNEVFAWSFGDGWLSRWSITNFKDKQTFYQSSTTSGSVLANNDDEVILIAGLFIKEFYTRILFYLMIFIIFMTVIGKGA